MRCDLAEGGAKEPYERFSYIQHNIRMGRAISCTALIQPHFEKSQYRWRSSVLSFTALVVIHTASPRAAETRWGLRSGSRAFVGNHKRYLVFTPTVSCDGFQDVVAGSHPRGSLFRVC